MIRLLAAFLCLGAAAGEPSPFLASPYLQFNGSMLVLWHALDDGAEWRADYSTAPGQWTSASLTSRRVAVKGVPPYRVHQAVLSALPPNRDFDYRVYRAAQQVFTSHARGWKGRGKPLRFTVVGDTGDGSSSEKGIVHRIAQTNPDFIFVVGDIVYDQGRAQQYWKNFFPIYNADRAAPDTGAPILRSVVTLAAPGNHDIVESLNLRLRPDGLAYFLFWAPPMNGYPFPGPVLRGPLANQKAFLDAAGENFPRTLNFSFDWGDTHWLVLDSNPYRNWPQMIQNDARLRDWIIGDLNAPTGARWKFVAFHHPPYHSSNKHQDQQDMRALVPIFEKAGVDIVWTGHVHNYQRTFPLRAGEPDRKFNGSTITKADGVIYVVTGGGGADLRDEARDARPKRWKPFTANYIGSVHSFTSVEVTPQRLEVRQLDSLGKERDRFVLTH